MAGDRHCLAIKTNGTLWAWGKNDVGQLGLGEITRMANWLGDTSPRSSPVQIGEVQNWKTMALGGVHAFGIRKN